MTNQDQIVALAELDGFIFDEIKPYAYSWCCNHKFVMWKAGVCVKCVPNYLTSYDAILPLIQKQDPDVMKAITLRFVDGSEQADYTGMYMLMTAPAQLCEALLRATGKWKDDNDTTTVIEGNTK